MIVARKEPKIIAIVKFCMGQEWEEFWSWYTFEDFSTVLWCRCFIFHVHPCGDKRNEQRLLVQRHAQFHTTKKYTTVFVVGDNEHRIYHAKREELAEKWQAESAPVMYLHCCKFRERERIRQLERIVWWAPVIQKTFDDVGNTIRIQPSGMALIATSNDLAACIDPQRILQYNFLAVQP